MFVQRCADWLFRPAREPAVSDSYLLQASVNDRAHDMRPTLRQARLSLLGRLRSKDTVAGEHVAPPVGDPGRGRFLKRDSLHLSPYA